MCATIIGTPIMANYVAIFPYSYINMGKIVGEISCVNLLYMYI